MTLKLQTSILVSHWRFKLPLLESLREISTLFTQSQNVPLCFTEHYFRFAQAQCPQYSISRDWNATCAAKNKTQQATDRSKSCIFLFLSVFVGREEVVAFFYTRLNEQNKVHLCGHLQADKIRADDSRE